MLDTWFIIANPTSGNGIVLKKWNQIISSLNAHQLNYEYSFSEYKGHEQELVSSAIKKGYRKIISVGGDGTLHQITNGIMSQTIIDPIALKVGIIPMGTGNDWVKTYKIPKHINDAISILVKEKTSIQDIGKLQLINTNSIVYFNNLAGIGFDGFVIKNLSSYKKFGSVSYLIATIVSFLKYKNSLVSIEFNNKKITANVLLVLVGICKYSGGGMKLTENVNSTDNLFDISIAKNFNFLKVILNIIRFYNGSITKHKEVETYKTSAIKISTNTQNMFVQADGELIGKGGFKATSIPKAITYVIP